MIPLIIGYDKSISKYVKFSYLKDNDSSDTPRLIQTYLDTVPDDLSHYIVNYPVVSTGYSSHSVGLGSHHDKNPYCFSNSNNPTEGYSCSFSQHRDQLPTYLQNLVIIDSTLSGDKKSQLYFSILQPLLNIFGIAHFYVSTNSPSTISDHARAFTSSSTVVFLGGDTSIHEFVNHLPEIHQDMAINIGVIPTGTGNALSNSIGHDGEPHAITRIFCGTLEPLSTFKVDFPEGTVDYNTRTPIKSLQSVVVTSWAFHAALVADSDAPQYRKLGSLRFQKAAEELLSQSQQYDATVKFFTHDKAYQLKGPHSYLLFTMVSALEKTFKISPDSHSPSDTTIRIIQFDHLGGNQIMEIMKAVYENARHVHDPRLIYKPIDNDIRNMASEAIVEIDISDHQSGHDRWCVDGRILSVPCGQLKLYPPSYRSHGWNLRIIV